MDSTPGIIRTSTLESFFQEKNMDWGSGRKIQPMISMKANMLIIKSKETVNIDGAMEIYIKEILRTISEIELEQCYGVLARFIEGLGEMVSRMGLALFILPKEIKLFLSENHTS